MDCFQFPVFLIAGRSVDQPRRPCLARVPLDGSCPKRFGLRTIGDVVAPPVQNGLAPILLAQPRLQVGTKAHPRSFDQRVQSPTSDPWCQDYKAKWDEAGAAWRDYPSTADQLADVLTKGLRAEAHARFLDRVLAGGLVRTSVVLSTAADPVAAVET